MEFMFIVHEINKSIPLYKFFFFIIIFTHSRVTHSDEKKMKTVQINVLEKQC